MILMRKGRYITMSTKAWVRLPVAAIKDESLTPCALLSLATIIDKAGSDRTARLTAAEIAAETGYKERWTKSALKLLEERRYIAIERRPGKASIFHQLIVDPIDEGKRKGKRKQEQDFSKYDFVINNFPEEVNAK